jgi:hypothetical protein
MNGPKNDFLKKKKIKKVVKTLAMFKIKEERNKLLI